MRVGSVRVCLNPHFTMLQVSRLHARVIFCALAALALVYVGFLKYRVSPLAVSLSRARRETDVVKLVKSSEKDRAEDDDRAQHRRTGASGETNGELLRAESESSSTSLCEELVQSSRDHLRSIKLLTLAQFPSAARNEQEDAQSPDSEDASPSIAPVSTRFQCDDSETTSSSPKRMLDVFLFGGGEVDTLEIRLYELYDVVDAFIAVTSNVTHKGEPSFDALRPLLRTKRFERFRDKVEIFECGQSGVAAPEGVNFQFEAEKESVVAKYLAEKYGDDTLVIFGHVDEIPAREDVWKLTNCEGRRALPGNFGIWFPFGNVDYAFRSDFPARNKPWTLGDPGVTTANRLNDMGLPRGRFEHVLGRGFHATNYCFPPQYVLKMMTATEYRGFDAVIEEMKSAIGENKTCAQIMQGLRERCLNDPLRAFGSRMRRVRDLVSSGENAEQFYVPHALREDNYTKYPSWDPTGRAVDWRAAAAPRS